MGSGPEGDNVLKNRGGNFCPSVGGRGSLRGDGAWPGGKGKGGWRQVGWGLGRVSKGLGGWGLGGAEGLGSGSDVRSLGRTDGKFTPLSYRTSSPSGPLPKKVNEVTIIVCFKT